MGKDNVLMDQMKGMNLVSPELVQLVRSDVLTGVLSIHKCNKENVNAKFSLRWHGQACIPETSVCNGYSDCSNGMDESADFCQDWTCPADSFTCLNNTNGPKCLQQYQLCNGRDDCTDGADESVETCDKINCTSSSYFRCPNRLTGKLCIIYWD